MTERRGDYITTYTGKRFYPLDARVEDVDITDIAHALSNQCRFAGHCNIFYSVAQHAILVSQMCRPEDALFGLLHDASEAFLCDVPTPLKRQPEFEPYRNAEKALMNIICDAFGLVHDEPVSVKEADKRMLATEARDLTFTAGRGWTTMNAEPYDWHVQAWSPEYTRVKFLSRFHELGGYK